LRLDIRGSVHAPTARLFCVPYVSPFDFYGREDPSGHKKIFYFHGFKWCPGAESNCLLCYWIGVILE
jgi:hypothetical protein